MALITVDNSIVGARLNGIECPTGIKLNGVVIKTFAPPEPNIMFVLDSTNPNTSALQSLLTTKFKASGKQLRFFTFQDTEQGIASIRSLPSKVNSGTVAIFYFNYKFFEEQSSIFTDEVGPTIQSLYNLYQVVYNSDWGNYSCIHSIKVIPQGMKFIETLDTSVYQQVINNPKTPRMIVGISASEGENWDERENNSILRDWSQPHIDAGDLISPNSSDRFVLNTVPCNSFDEACQGVDELFNDSIFPDGEVHTTLFIAFNETVAAAIFEVGNSYGYDLSNFFICVLSSDLYNENPGYTEGMVSDGNYKLYTVYNDSSIYDRLYEYYTEIVINGSSDVEPDQEWDLTEVYCYYQ